MARGMRRAIRRFASEDTRQLRARIDHLETSLEALQDSVYRDVQRQDSELAELRRLVDPENLVRALSEDARRRGL